jgi:hypothetical protein
MYLKKVDGPRAVTLPDGTVLTRADLPDPGVVRWVASRKASVVKAVRHGLVARGEVIERYGISEEELDSWMAAVERHGEVALKATAVRRYRQP